jgi:hypothetical protein
VELLDELLRRESALLQPEVRRSREALEDLLAEDFQEFGSSGRIYSRADVIEPASTEPQFHYEIGDFSAALLAPGVALAKYRAARYDASGQLESRSLRSSVWVWCDNRWQMLFHQGTKVPAEALTGDPIALAGLIRT